MTTETTSPLLSYNGIGLKVSLDTLTDVFGEPDYYDDAYVWSISKDNRVVNLIVGYPNNLNRFYIYGEGKLKDLSTGKILIGQINEKISIHKNKFYLEPEGRNWYYQTQK